MAQLSFPTAPGVTVNIAAATGGTNAAAPSAAAFVVGIADRGPTVPIQVLDFLDFQAKFGSRNAAAAVLSDSVETMFAEGTTTMFVARVVGPGATYGQLQLVDRTGGTPLNTMLVKSAFYGAQSANLTIQIVAGTVANSFDLLVYDSASSTPTFPVETWRDNTSVANAVAAINAGSVYLTATDNASASSGTQAFPALMAGTALSAGTDDRANANDTTWGNALNAFSPNLPGGLLLAPGRYTSSIHAIMQTAAVAGFRFALTDTAPLPAAADITAQALADSVGAGYLDPGDSSIVGGPWVTIPPAPGGSVVRQVPLSALLAGLIATADNTSGTSNLAAMGFYGIAKFANGIVGPGFIESDRVAINGRAGTTGGVIVRSVPGGARCQVFGFRTVSAQARSYSAANVRETIALKRDIETIGEAFVGRQIDGQGFIFQDLSNAIGLRLLQSFQAKSLFGASSTAAYGVDVGPTVNTPQSIAAGIIRARVWFIPSPTAERVFIDLVRQGIPT